MSVSVSPEQSGLGTFGAFIEQRYEPWAREYLHDEAAGARLRTEFADWIDEPLSTLSAWRIESWRRDRIEASAQPGLVSQQLQELETCLCKAVEWEVITRNPLRELGLENGAQYFIELFAGGTGQAHLRDGWAWIGINSTWTSGNRAVIELPKLNISAGDYVLKLSILGVVNPKPSPCQRIFAAVNDVTIGSIICRGPAVYEFVVPASAMTAREHVEVVLNLPDACRSMDEQEDATARFLALRLAKIELRPLELIRETSEERSGLQIRAGDLVDQRAALQEMASLGYNCEFGFVQRAVGAEPMGLFRWSASPSIPCSSLSNSSSRASTPAMRSSSK